MNDPRGAIAVALGATAGATVRWAVVEAFPQPSGWPWAIFVVNVVGSLLLGVVLGATHHRTDEPTSDPIRLAVGTGFCGALTTFATFAVDVASFLRDGGVQLGFGYLVVSLALGLAAVAFGHVAAGRRGQVQRSS